MGLRIKNPVRGLSGARNFSSVSRRVTTNFERLLSGRRISRSKDNPASFRIATQMNGRLRVLGQVIRNVSDGVSFAQTADASLGQTSRLIHDIRLLAQESASAPLDFDQRFSRQVEVDQKLDEIDHIMGTTRFGDEPIFGESLRTLKLQTGTRPGDAISVRIPVMNTFNLGRQVREYGFEIDPSVPIEDNSIFVNDIEIRRTEDADDNVSFVFPDGSAIAKAKALNDATPFTGVEVRPDTTTAYGFFPLGGLLDDLDNIVINGETISGFNVLSGDADKRLRNEINGRSAVTGVVARLDEQQNLLLEAEDGRNIELETSTFEAAAITGLNDGFPGVEVYGAALQFLSRDAFEINLQGLDMDFAIGIGPGAGRHGFGLDARHALGTIDITTREEAERSIEIADVAMEEVTHTRDELGGVLTQLHSNLFSSESNKIHLEFSRHQIQDTDMLAEVADYARNHIVQSASASILSQANFVENSALYLLEDFQVNRIAPGDALGGIGAAATSILAPGQQSGGLFKQSFNRIGFDQNTFKTTFSGLGKTQK